MKEEFGKDVLFGWTEQSDHENGELDESAGRCLTIRLRSEDCEKGRRNREIEKRMKSRNEESRESVGFDDGLLSLVLIG